MENKYINSELYNKVLKNLTTEYKNLYTGYSFKEEAKIVIKFDNYVYQEIKSVTEKICNESILEIPGIINKESLYKYRVYIGAITDPKFRPKYNGFNTIKASIIRKIIASAQVNYYKNQEAIDIKTPLKNIYLTKNAWYMFSKYIDVEEPTFEHLIAVYQLLSSKRYFYYSDVCREFEDIIVACGYEDSIEVTNKYSLTKKYLRLLNELSEILNSHKQLTAEYKTKKLELDRVSKQLEKKNK